MLDSHRPPVRLAAVLVAALLASPIRAQTAPPGDDRPGVAPPVPTTRPAAAPPVTRAPSPDAAAPADGPQRLLLREGLALVEAHGTVRQDAARGTWEFVIEPDQGGAAGYALTLLPSARLEEMVRAVRAAPDRETVFEVTGHVYVYQRRNYLLPTHAPQLTQRSTAGADATGGRSPEPAVEPEPESGGPDAARRIMRDLERDIGPLARSSSGAVDESPPPDRPIMREGTLLLSRRGQVRRNRTGAWLFVFDADAEGLADPPMVLLPCLMLETIERHGRRGQNDPVLISGTVHTYRGANYLLPTMMQVTRMRTSIVP